jgi:small subunit ribosomal protein S25e
MGGMKKKPIGSANKATTNNATSPSGDIKTTKKEDLKKTVAKPQKKQKLSVLVEEYQGMKALQGMKAITIQSFARTSGVKISVANSFLKSLEAKGVVKNVGGYSGHRVYKLEK